MSRHRIVRSMNYDEERYDDDEYDMGQSYEDRYCVSPSTAAQFTFNRDRGVDLSSFMVEEEIPEEADGDGEMHIKVKSPAVQDTASKVDQARLHSCLDELRNILGDSIPEAVLAQAVMQHNYNLEAALNEILTIQDAPKPQRTQRKRRDQAQEDDKSIEAFFHEIDCLDNQKPVMHGSSTEQFGSISSTNLSPKIKPCSSQQPKDFLKQNYIFTSSWDGSKSTAGGKQFVPPSSVGDSLGEQHPGTLSLSSTGGNSSVGEKPGSSIFCTETSNSKPGTPVALEATNESRNRGPSLAELVSKHGKAKQSSLQGITSESRYPKEVRKEEQGQGPPSLVELTHTHSSNGASVSDSVVPCITTGETFQLKPSLSSLISQKTETGNSSLNIQLPAHVDKTWINMGKNHFMVPSQSADVAERKTVLSFDTVHMKGEHSSDSLPGLKPLPSSEAKISLAELVKRHTQSSGSSLDVLSSAKEEKSLVSETVKSGVFLASLVKQPKISQGMQNQLDISEANKTCVSESTSSGVSLASLIRQHKMSEMSEELQCQMEVAEKNNCLVSENCSTGAPIESILKQREISQGFHTSPDIAKTQQSEEEILKKLESLEIRLRGSVKLVHEMSDWNIQNVSVSKNQDWNKLSLESCLKKTQKLQEHDVHHKQSIISLTMDEGFDYKQETQDQSPDFFSRNTFDSTLVKAPSSFARCLGYQWLRCSRSRKSDVKPQRTVKFKKFQYKHQTRNLPAAPSVVLHKIRWFAFDKPSPDDLIKAKQQAAFTRSDQPMEEG